MLTLIQFPWSPFCITIRHILDRHGIRYRLNNIPNHDRTAVIKATGGRAYTVPCIVDGRTAVADCTDFGQEVARYLDRKFRLGLVSNSSSPGTSKMNWRTLASASTTAT
jgi:glutathione S-transferase